MQELKSNIDYQANRTHLSSSMLKLLLKNPAEFQKQWFGNLEQQSKDVFDEGSFVHSLILEPDCISQYAIFSGLRKYGKLYDEFKSLHPGKIILSAAQVIRCEKLVVACKSSASAVKLLSGGVAESAITSNILDIPVKMRADYIVPGKYIVDVKTTSMPTDVECFKQTVKDYGYDLSASLYCQIAYDAFGALHDFFFIVLSKSDGGCAIYKMSSETLSIGNSLVTKAIVMYKKCLTSGVWSHEQEVSSSISNEAELI